MLGLLYVPQLATISATFPAMFPTHVRYAGFAIAYNVSTSLFGGTAPAVNDWLIGRTGDNLVPAYYMMARLCHRRDRPDQGARDHPLPDQRHGDTGTPEAPPQLDVRDSRPPREPVGSAGLRHPGGPVVSGQAR